MKRLPLLILAAALGLAACAPANDGLPSPTDSKVVQPTAAATGAATATSGGPVASTVIAATAQPGATIQPGSNGTPVPDDFAPTPIPTLTSGSGPTELKYQLLAQYPDLFFCDPDYYPVAHDDEAQLASQRFPQIQSNPEEFDAITKYLGLSGQTFSDDQKLAVYREHKRLSAISFEPAGGGYQFQLQTQDAQGKGLLITGRIDGSGAVSAQQSQPTVTTCPICLAAGTLIDTPSGAVPVAALRVGDLVWTLDASGARVAAPLALVGHVPAPAQHHMVHLVLTDGRELWASPGHPTADGRRLGQLQPGDALDGASVLSADRVAYDQPFTYDILPAGATGLYWANGVLLASTLR